MGHAEATSPHATWASYSLGLIWRPKSPESTTAARAAVKSSHGSWFYRADIGPDPITGKRREQHKGGFRTAKEAQGTTSNRVTALCQQQSSPRQAWMPS